MPFVQLSAPADEFNVFWRSNIPDDDISQLGSKPVLVILVPGMMSIDLLDVQFEDPGLQKFHLLAFDPPGYGRTECPLFSTGEQVLSLDDWAMAALIGDFCLTLGIIQVHIMACMGWSAQVAVRFSILFPDMCKSIACAGVAIDQEKNQEYQDSMRDMSDHWVRTRDPDEIEACMQNFWFMFFGEARLTPEEHEQAIAHWKTYWRGKHALSNMMIAPVSLTRINLTPEQFALVKVPVLIMQGTTNPYLTAKMAQKLASVYTGFPGGARVEILQGAPYGMCTISEFAPRVNRLVAAHVEEAHLVTPRSGATERPDKRRIMKTAFDTLAQVASPGVRAQLTTRDCESVLSFALRPPEVVEEIRRTWLIPWSSLEQDSHM